MPGITRKPKTEKIYKKHTKSVRARAICEFCAFDDRIGHFVSSNEHFWVVRNLFPYDFWDSRKVKDHLLVVPKRHIESLSELTDDEKIAYADIIGQYDLLGYSSYARAAVNEMKSVAHHHTHLVSLALKPVRFIVFTNKPHFYWTR